jgi:hypothetical protein
MARAFGPALCLLQLRGVEGTGRRSHRSRQLHPPRTDHPTADLSKEQIKRRAALGGLINDHERAA